MSEDRVIRFGEVALTVGVVLALAVPGAMLLLWAEAREYSDNQRNWAYAGGWLGIGGAGVIALLASASAVRNRGTRGTQLIFATGLLAFSATVLAALILRG